MTYHAHTAVSAKLHAVLTRADGTVVDLGQIGYWHKNPLKRLAWRISRFLRIPTTW